MPYPQLTYTYRGIDARLTWIRNSQLGEYSPITQAYGIIFNKKNEILICRPEVNASWKIPGGTPEAGETIEETLRRELIEEADITCARIYPLGAQRVEMKNNPENMKEICSTNFVL